MINPNQTRSLKNSHCKICTARSMEHIHAKNFLDLDYSKNPLEVTYINYLLCNSCGAVSQQLIPSKETLAKYYQTSLSHSSPPPLVTDRFFRKRLDDLLSNIELDFKELKILEIGCSNADFAQLLIEKGAMVFGVEPCKSASSIAKKRGVDIIGKDLANMDDKFNGFFDLVISMGTFEHLAVPSESFSSMISFVREGGFVYIDVPDNQSIAQGLKNDWGTNIIAPHIHHFSPKSLFLLFFNNSVMPIYFESCKEIIYNSQAIIGKKLSPAIFGMQSFLGAVTAENAHLLNIANELNNFINKNIYNSVVFWGASSDLFSIFAQGFKFTCDFVLIDKSELKSGKQFCGLEVSQPSQIRSCDLLVITVFDPRISAAIRLDAVLLFPQSKIISFSDSLSWSDLG